jgi:hypothetical protein
MEVNRVSSKRMIVVVSLFVMLFVAVSPAFAQGPTGYASQGFVQRGVHGWQTCPTDYLKKSQLPSRLLGDQVVGQVLDDGQPVVETVPGVNFHVLVIHTARGEQPVE